MNEVAFRTSEWPTDPRPVLGEPILEFVTRSDLLSRGWTIALIQRFAGTEDGTRPSGKGGKRFYYRLDRILEIEQTEPLQAVLAQNASSAQGSSAILPLALQERQLLQRGWTRPLIRKFLQNPDAILTHEGRQQSLYAAERVAAKEADEQLLVELRKRQEKKVRARERRQQKHIERAERDRRARKTLCATFPAFTVAVELPEGAHRCRVCIDGWEMTTQETQAISLARGAQETGAWTPFIDWLLEQEEIGSPEFRLALGFLAVGDKSGFDAWNSVCRREQLLRTWHSNGRKWGRAGLQELSLLEDALTRFDAAEASLVGSASSDSQSESALILQGHRADVVRLTRRNIQMLNSGNRKYLDDGLVIAFARGAVELFREEKDRRASPEG